MPTINKNFLKLQSNYLFSDIAKKVAAYKEENPSADIISLGIGDVTRPLIPACIEAMHKAVDEMANADTFRGYPPEQGYDFLLEAIVKNDYLDRGVELDKSEVFVSDGAKCDCGNIGDIFGTDNVVAVCDPVYPVYVDTNVMAGRAGEFNGGKWSKIVYMPSTKENGFFPDFPKEHADMIYLCFPNNPSGQGATRQQLQKWVDFALRENSVILYDSAYEAYITDGDMPHTIYEIEGAKKCCIEFRSFSKTAGFTGTRCAYCVIPKELTVEGTSLNSLWARRQATKFNGVSYITQRGAEAIYSEQGKKEIKELIAYYQANAKVIYEGLKEAGFKVSGAVNSPYIWLEVPQGMTSWDFFDVLLRQANVVGTPGSGFGPAGEGYFRLTAFGSAERTKQAVERIVKVFKS